MARRPHYKNFDPVRVRAVREGQELTLKDVSERCAKAGDRIHISILSRYESGAYGPTWSRMKVLARALNCRIDDLLTPTDEVRRESA